MNSIDEMKRINCHTSLSLKILMNSVGNIDIGINTFSGCSFGEESGMLGIYHPSESLPIQGYHHCSLLIGLFGSCSVYPSIYLSIHRYMHSTNTWAWPSIYACLWRAHILVKFTCKSWRGWYLWWIKYLQSICSHMTRMRCSLYTCTDVSLTYSQSHGGFQAEVGPRALSCRFSCLLPFTIQMGHRTLFHFRWAVVNEPSLLSSLDFFLFHGITGSMKPNHSLGRWENRSQWGNSLNPLLT